MLTAPIQRGTLSDRIKDRLLQEILAGHYAPGARIVETRVARELGVSQAPVREALRDLEAVGIVEITAFQGARVRRPGKADLLEAFGVRAELETLGARLAVARLTDDDVIELQGYVDRMRLLAARGDPHAEALVDTTFHARVIEIAGNRTLERVWRYLEPASRTYITLVVPGVDSRQVAELHQPILDGLRRRSAPDTVDAVRRHFEVAGALFDSLFEEPRVDTAGDHDEPDADTAPLPAATVAHAGAS
jgi:DNA-binding GntR family transcriptional regulator